MRYFITKWYPTFLLFLLLSGGYLYNSYTPWNSYLLDGKVFWYKLLWKGEKVGSVQVSYKLLENNIFQVSQSTRVNTTNRGEIVLLVEKEVLNFDMKDSAELSSIFYHRQQDDYIEQTELIKVGDYLQGEKLIQNKPLKISFKLVSFQLSEFLALMRWSHQDPIIGETLQVRRFDLDELTLNPVTYKLIENTEYGDGYTAEFHEQGRSWNGFVDLDYTGVPQRFYIGQMVEQQLSTENEALSDNSQVDYYQAQVISIDKPLGNAVKLNSLILTTTSLSSTDIVNDRRQYWDAKDELHLSNLRSPKSATKEELRSYSNHSLVDEHLLELAKTVIGSSEKTEQKVAKLLAFVSAYLKDVPVIRPMSLETIIEQRKGDCTEHTQLFIALARAVDIPAREVKGLVYLGDEIQGFGGHVWSEVAIDNNWVAVDPTWNLQQLSATHIQLEESGSHSLLNEMHSNSALAFSLKSAIYQQ